MTCKGFTFLRPRYVLTVWLVCWHGLPAFGDGRVLLCAMPRLLDVSLMRVLCSVSVARRIFHKNKVQYLAARRIFFVKETVQYLACSTYLSLKKRLPTLWDSRGENHPKNVPVRVAISVDDSKLITASATRSSP